MKKKRENSIKKKSKITSQDTLGDKKPDNSGDDMSTFIHDNMP